jgi:hypothetical protein
MSSEEPLICPICLDTIEISCFNPCSHVFCEKCIDSWKVINKKNGRSFSCPVCRCSITDPSEDLLPSFDNLVLEDIPEPPVHYNHQHDDDEPSYYFDPYTEEYVYNTQEPEEDPDSELNGYF